MNERLSVILPCRNEERFIENVLEFFVNAEPKNKELIIADGDSTDKTREIISSWQVRHPEIMLVSNPKRFVPFALNECIRRSSGDYVVRLDAHTEYAPDYFTTILDTFNRTGSEIVGGPMRAKGKSSFQRAVAVCTSTSFGVGDSKFHDDKAEGYTDSVYLGAWKKSIFQTTGLFDEEMLRNQDDEFHYRAKSKGMKIFLNPQIRSWYYPRATFGKLFKQYFQYGLFKPLVLKKVSAGMRPRHLIPSAFVLYLVTLMLFFKIAGWISLIPLALYIAGDIYFSFFKQRSLAEKFHALYIYPALHIAYGSGFILGLSNSVRKLFFNG